jgi:hypothetical protein
VSDTGDVATDLRLIASAGLHDGTIRVASERWARVLGGLKSHRLTGLAVAAYETGQLPLDAPQGDVLLQHHRSVMADALRIEQRMLQLHDAFATRGIRVVVLKGPSVAHTVYPDPAMRPFGDLDLLVSTTDWRAACRTLRDNGFTRDLPEPRRGFDERFGKAATHSDESGLQIDLHRTLVVGPFGLWLDPNELLRYTGTFALGGRTIARLDATGLLLNAALHAGLGTSSPLLLPLRDVAEAARSPEVDWDRLAAWTKRWNLSAAVGHAFASVSRDLLFELPPRAREISSVRLRPGERRAMRAYTDRRRSGGVALATMAAIPGLRAKAVYVFDLAMPSREFMEARAAKGTQASYVSRLRVPVRWIARRNRGSGRGDRVGGRGGRGGEA